ncbi:MAG: DUF2851 family protein [Bacteroidetes bacterium]|nr:DUF2851 family protein [Bacteroidota bacterium]
MKEDLLHYIWRYSLYDTNALQTTAGEAVQIIRPGQYNTDAGADFTNARIRIGETLLAGNVEIHLHQRDWYAHGHDDDAAYNNVILHVVYDTDTTPTLLQNGQPLAVLSLKGHISTTLLQRYELLKGSLDKIPCAALIRSLPINTSLASFYDRLVIERLQAKVAVIEAMLQQSRNDWDQVAFQMIATYYGGSVNKEPFQRLAASLPLTVVHKHRAEPKQIEALLFGQAGMLETEHDDEYPRSLRREYTYLRKLHNLQPLQLHEWKFFRIRPASFPTVKIAQLAALLAKEPHLFSGLLACGDRKDLQSFFEVEVNEYWHGHYQFDKPSAKGSTGIGHMLTDVVVINAVVPLLFCYGRYKGDDKLCQRAMDMLYEVAAENNAIIRMWDALGIKAQTANDTQALLQLRSDYCLRGRCLQCRIGHELLNSTM